MRYVIPFSEIGINDVSQVGGKNASLGEMFQNLSAAGIKVPNGFATTADAYRDFIQKNNLYDRIAAILQEMDKDDLKSLA